MHSFLMIVKNLILNYPFMNFLNDESSDSTHHRRFRALKEIVRLFLSTSYRCNDREPRSNLLCSNHRDYSLI